MQEGTYRGTRRVVWGAARDLIDGVHRKSATQDKADRRASIGLLV